MPTKEINQITNVAFYDIETGEKLADFDVGDIDQEITSEFQIDEQTIKVFDDGELSIWLEFVPARKHKKKRIAKKWLKRYGYKSVYLM